MKKVFIAYGTGAYKKSLRRIGKEARRLGIFSKVILYTDKDMPAFIQASPLKAYERGNGYWVWKPYIIWKTMQDYPDSIVVYVDCGCTLQPNMKEWNRWFELLETYDALTFQHRSDFVYPWQKEGKIRSRGAEWTKSSLIEYFDSLIGNRDWIECGQVMGGIVLACRNSGLIKMWLDITLMRPDLLMDCFGNEIVQQEECFIEHRHDQSLLSALCAYWSKEGNSVKVLPETAESRSDSAVVASRIKEEYSNHAIPLKTRIIRMAKRMIGEKGYNSMHSVFGKNRNE